jgi:hypothetical protein
MKRILLGFITLLMFITTANASRDIKIGSGNKGGNYYTVAQDIVDFCGDEIQKKYGYPLINVETGGSIDNLQGILHKKYSIGFIQQDVMEYFKKRDQLNTIENTTVKVMNLYPEYLTILIPKGWEPKNNEGFFSKFSSLFSGNKNKTTTIMSLKNQVVYAKGGALVSAQALSYFMGLNLHVVNAAKAKHINGPFIFVTGSGDPRIQKMLATGKWFLLSFNGNELANRVSFYKPATVTYIVNGKTISANTVAIMSVAYARKYRSKKRKAAIKAIKQCVKANIDDLIDDGNSDKWNIIARVNGWDNKEGE